MAPPTPTQPAPQVEPAAAARWAHDYGSTIARAALLHGCDRDAVLEAWNRLYPSERRTFVP